MDFEDERYLGHGEDESSPSKTSSSATSIASSPARDQVRVSIRGRNAATGRVRPRTDQANVSDDGASIGSSAIIQKPMVVRGAGASAWAVQDAGTIQMLNDECAYLCSALLSARSAPQALETAVELAQLLSSKKSRSVLWQNYCTNHSSRNKIMAAAAAAATSPASPTRNSAPPSKSVLDAILDVIAFAGKAGSVTTSSSNRSLRKSSATAAAAENIYNSDNSTAVGSPSRSTAARTKSARRKLKQQSQMLAPLNDAPTTTAMSSGRGVSAPVCSSWWSQAATIPELSQTLAIIIYFLSVDCTLSKDHSVAAMGSVPKPGTARALRMGILQHGKALQGMIRLCCKEKEPSSSSGNTKSSVRGIPLSVHSSSLSKTTTRPHGNMEKLSQSPLAESSLDSSTAPRHKRRRMTNNDAKRSVASSPTDDSLSSLSMIGGDTNNNSITPKASGSSIGDPTKAGRQNRKRRRLLIQSDPALVIKEQPKLPAVPEHGNDDDDMNDELDWPGSNKQILPPPSKMRARTVQGKLGSTNLSFTSEANTSADGLSNESSLFTVPASPAKKSGAEPPFALGSPDGNKSVASVESSASLVVTARLAQKLHQLKSKVHLSSLTGEEDSTSTLVQDHDCNKVSSGETAGVDPWVALVCLQSLNRIITGKEGDEQSCIAEEEPQQDEEGPSVDDEESNPLLQTNRLLGDSGIIPLLSKCMSQELEASPIILSAVSSKTCQTCDKNWYQRISLLASLIDGACLFNRSNRRAFVEHHDPFSFEDDPLQSKDGKGLIFHILWFLHNAIPTVRSNKEDYRAAEESTRLDDTHVSGARLLALRTLTSLTHDNNLAAQQMTACHNFDSDQGSSSIEFDKDDADSTASLSVRGIDILAKLVFELESGPTLTNGEAAAGADEEKSHLYDSTICCLNTLANIIEATDVRRLLADITVPADSDGGSELWIQWLCKWLVHQTENFRDAILSIGKKQTSSQDSERELEKHEDDKLVAAGNACVLLACLMKEPEEIQEEPESTSAIRKVILEQMPLDKKKKSTGLTMIINTLKAFCNYYHFSLGELSMAIVAPVKKLIESLEELRKK